MSAGHRRIDGRSKSVPKGILACALPVGLASGQIIFLQRSVADSGAGRAPGGRCNRVKPAAWSGYKTRQNFARQCRCRWYRSRQTRHSDVVRCHDRMLATEIATTSRSSTLPLCGRSRSEPPAFLWSRFSLQQGQDRDVAGRKARRFRCHTAVFALPGHAMHHDQPECLCQMRRGGLICRCVVRGLRCQMAARPSARPALLHLPSSSTAIFAT